MLVVRARSSSTHAPALVLTPNPVFTTMAAPDLRVDSLPPLAHAGQLRAGPGSRDGHSPLSPCWPVSHGVGARAFSCPPFHVTVCCNVSLCFGPSLTWPGSHPVGRAEGASSCRTRLGHSAPPISQQLDPAGPTRLVFCLPTTTHTHSTCSPSLQAPLTVRSASRTRNTTPLTFNHVRT